MRRSAAALWFSALLAVPAGDACALNVTELMEFLEAEVPEEAEVPAAS